MKKRIITTILAATMLMGLVGCGAKEDTFEHIEETSIEEITVEVEETIQESEVETEFVEETTIEENETVEPMSFERENHVITACMTNLSSDTTFGRLIAENDDTYNTNDYLDIDIMTELANRGYDIDGFAVTWMVAVNEDGMSNWKDLGQLSYSKVNDSEEHFVKLYPLFIKNGNLDFSRIIWNKYNGNDCWEHSENYNPDDDSCWNAVHKAVYDMKQDENYVEIDFNIPDTDFAKYFERVSQERQAEDENVLIKDFTINDWYNGMIYAMFESKTVDLDGFFDCCAN